MTQPNMIRTARSSLSLFLSLTHTHPCDFKPQPNTQHSNSQPSPSHSQPFAHVLGVVGLAARRPPPVPAPLCPVASAGSVEPPLRMAPPPVLRTYMGVELRSSAVTVPKRVNRAP